MQPSPLDLVVVATYRFLPEAEVAKLHLEEAGIEVFLADAEIVNMDWLLGNAVGDIKLQVPRPQVEAAVAVLEQVAAAKANNPPLRTDPEDLSGSDTCLSCGATLGEASVCPKCGWSYGTSPEPEAEEDADE